MAETKKIVKKQKAAPRVLNAFEAFFSSQNEAKAEEKEKNEATKPPAKRKSRDESITKVCTNCGKQYHPTRNGYAHVSKYCSPKCAMARNRGKLKLN